MSMPLTHIEIKNLQPESKSKKYFDGKGLYLLVSPNGGKWWRIKYRIHGKEKLLSLGTFPEVSLSQARKNRDEFRKQIAQNIDPSLERQIIKQIFKRSKGFKFDPKKVMEEKMNEKKIFDLAEYDERVEHPAHYTHGKVECLDAIDSATSSMPGNVAVYVANVMKYLWRHHRKHNRPLEDLLKAKFYFDKLIKHYAENENENKQKD